MSDVIEEAARTKAGKVDRARQLHAIRVLAKHGALDLVPMLFAPLGPTYNPDVWAKKRKRAEA